MMQAKKQMMQAKKQTIQAKNLMKHSTKQTVFDPLRKAHVALTPEEEVRQYIINWLHKERNYPLSLMASEYTITLNKLTFRCDIVIFNRDLTPHLIVECKAPTVKLDNAVLDQITKYNMVLKVKHLIITNGVTTFAFNLNPDSNKYTFAEEIPFYEPQGKVQSNKTTEQNELSRK